MLFRCMCCGKISRVNDNLVTDWNTKIDIHEDKAICPCCNSQSDYQLINCEDWIEELLFKIKGN